MVAIILLFDGWLSTPPLLICGGLILDDTCTVHLLRIALSKMGVVLVSVAVVVAGSVKLAMHADLRLVIAPSNVDVFENLEDLTSQKKKRYI